VAVVDDVPVSSLVALMVAPGIAAPLGSVTVPYNVDVIIWAEARLTQKKKTASGSIVIMLNRRIESPYSI